MGDCDMLSFLISPAPFQHILRTDFLSSVVSLAPLLLNLSPALIILSHLRKSQIKEKKPTTIELYYCILAMRM